MRWIALCVLMGVAGPLCAADPPVAQQAFYKRLAADWLAKNAPAVARSFDSFVNLRLTGGKLKRYRRDQAANVLRTHLRGITPIAKSSKISQWSRSSMALLCSYYNQRGDLKKTTIFFNVRWDGAAYRVTSISR